MITLTRLNGKPFTLNAFYIEQVEAFPDTTITLTSGKKFIVRESTDDVVKLVTVFYRKTNMLGFQGNMEG
ncbi:flagellar FlbD family protein [Priestia abyssalis]|uniref:flagellar FlbD family protein n=1 Tax=Priestia abyssalis TaxID=1221450 RepID=UPI0009953BB5|nr:flagellar FlbD family protein [Priestia abyssalis]